MGTYTLKLQVSGIALCEVVGLNGIHIIEGSDSGLVFSRLIIALAGIDFEGRKHLKTSIGRDGTR